VNDHPHPIIEAQIELDSNQQSIDRAPLMEFRTKKKEDGAMLERIENFQIPGLMRMSPATPKQLSILTTLSSFDETSSAWSRARTEDQSDDATWSTVKKMSFRHG
jgi:hypothetical protein